MPQSIRTADTTLLDFPYIATQLALPIHPLHRYLHARLSCENQDKLETRLTSSINNLKHSTSCKCTSISGPSNQEKFLFSRK
eukprot:3305740-Amphidinium_carterae.1